MEDAEQQLHVRATWLYFMEGMTQADIARHLGTTRLKINRILADARRNGLVSITINSPLASSVELEQELIRDFGLKGASIIPTPEDEGLVHNLIGRAAANYLAHFLEHNDIRGLGIGWGGTLREMVSQMPVGNYRNLSINSIMGGLTYGSDVNTFNIASELARRLRAECRYLAAPIYAGSEESRTIILEQDVFREAFRHIERSELVVISIGDATSKSMLVSLGLPSGAKTGDLKKAGAVCDVCGHFLNAEGKAIDHELNRRAITVSLETLGKIPTRVFAAGGSYKANAIAAALRSGLVSVLISDENTARKAAAIARK